MSEVTDIILTFSGIENENVKLKEINRWLLDNGKWGIFGEEATKISGGNKHLQCRIYVAAFNYFDEVKFLEYIFGLTWSDAASVQVFTKGEYNHILREWNWDSNPREEV
jgi:hypothetical protein